MEGEIIHEDESFILGEFVFRRQMKDSEYSFENIFQI